MSERVTQDRPGSKVALVTGGTRGIGRSITEALLGLGYVVIATYRENDVAAKALKKHVGPAGSLRTMRSDLCSDTETKALIDFLVNEYNLFWAPQPTDVQERNRAVNSRGLLNAANFGLRFDTADDVRDR